MGVDLNFNNATYTIIDLNGNLVSMGIIPFNGLSRALHLKKLAERIQKRYPRSWRFIKRVKRVRARWLRRTRNILNDSAHYIAKRLVNVAKEYNAVIVFEDLREMQENNNGNNRFSWKNHLWCYRRLQSYTKYKAVLEGIETIYVSAWKTSKKTQTVSH